RAPRVAHTETCQYDFLRLFAQCPRKLRSNRKRDGGRTRITEFLQRYYHTLWIQLRLLAYLLQHETIGLMHHEGVHIRGGPTALPQCVSYQNRDFAQRESEYVCAAHEQLLVGTQIAIVTWPPFRGFGRAGITEAASRHN